MTDFLVRVTSAAEVDLARHAGADVVEYAPADTGVDEFARAAAIRTAWPGRLRLHFAAASGSVAAFCLASGADECALPIAAIGDAPRDTARLIGLVPADPGNLREALTSPAPRIDAVMLVFAEGQSVFAATDISTLDAFARRHAADGLAVEIGGHIEGPDVARLLLLAPRTLGFCDTVRSATGGELDPTALEFMRALIPREGVSSPADRTGSGAQVDRIFVRDFVVDLAIGAYRSEHRGEQRVCFDVDVDVARQPRPPRDMRDVFSYDIVTELIRMLARRGHVLFVETLAEDLAGRILAQAGVVSTTVRVSKLDVIDGAVGIEIRRDRRIR